LDQTIFINDNKIELKSRDHLISVMDDFLIESYNEVWIKGQGESSLCVMTNSSSAFLMYLRHEGDSGFRSTNKSGDENKVEPFKLSNGQADEYPETWLIEKEKVRSALLTYFDMGIMDKDIDWTEEN